MFFMHDKFFKGLRLVIALDQSRVAIGEIAIDIIERDIIPNLQKEKSREKNERKKEQLSEEIREWQEYTKRSDKGRVWNEEATKIVSNIGNTRNWSESMKEEIAQDVISKFYQRESNLRKKLVNVKGGPIGLLKFFKRIIGDLTKDIGRSIRKDTLLIPLETDDDRGNIGDTLSSRTTDLSKQELKTMRNEMKRWVRPKLKKEGQVLFDMWWQEAEKFGPEKVNFSKIKPAWSEATGVKNISDNWIRIKKLIAQYLEDVEGLDLSPRAKKKLKISETIANNFIRRRFAKWMLELARQRGVI